MKVKGLGAGLKFASQKGKTLGKKKESILASIACYSPFKLQHRFCFNFMFSAFQLLRGKTQFDQVTLKCKYL